MRSMSDGAGVLWRNWRLLENRELYDIENDPHQDHNVAASHQLVVAKMRQHLHQWWIGVKDDVMTPQRVVIGSEQENPMLLTACEWLDIFVDQQRQVRRGDRKNGTWHLQVAETGDYRIELRRWPRESNLKITDTLPITKVTDGEFVAGESLPIAKAIIEVDDQKQDLSIQPGNDCFTGTIRLQRGPLKLRGTFLDADDNELVGAYYAYIERLAD